MLHLRVSTDHVIEQVRQHTPSGTCTLTQHQARVRMGLSLRNTRPWPSADLVAAALHPIIQSRVRLQLADKTAVRLLGSIE